MSEMLSPLLLKKPGSQGENGWQSCGPEATLRKNNQGCIVEEEKSPHAWPVTPSDGLCPLLCLPSVFEVADSGRRPGRNKLCTKSLCLRDKHW